MSGYAPDPNAVNARARLLLPLLDDWLRWKGVADPAMAEWAAPLIAEAQLEGHNTNTVAMRLRSYGRLLTADEKRAAGVPPRLKIGAAFAEALTDKGKDDVEATAFAIAHHPMIAYERGEAHGRAKLIGLGVRMQVLDDARTCDAGRGFVGKQFRSLETQPFPVKESCDRLVCMCRFEPVEPPLERSFEMRTTITLPSPPPEPETSSSARLIWALIAVVVIVVLGLVLRAG